MSAGASGDVRKTGRLRPSDVLDLGPAAARLGVLASLRTAGWLTSSTLAGGRRIAAAVRTGESPGELIGAAWHEARGAAREALGVTDIEETLGRITADGAAGTPDQESVPESLRARTEELLARSARVDAEDDEAHPAFGVVLEEVSPDELRILRLLASEGDKAAADVEASGPLGMGSRRVARRRSLIAELAGCRHPERLQLYLDNLLRLGLVELGDEPLDEGEYDVLEAQPDISEVKEEASEGTRRAKLVPRRLALSDFGRRFCDTCLPDA